jgi:U5 small nuclear ribonucleoprotein component
MIFTTSKLVELDADSYATDRSRFGNFIGEAESEDDVQSTGEAADAYVLDDEDQEEAEVNDQQLMEVDDGPSNAVVLHEDKQYYPSAADVYGPDVEILVQEEDAQSLAQPIIAPVVQKKFTVQETDLPPVYHSRELLTDLMNFPNQIRNIAIAGHLHHGKTAFMDMLVMETHDIQDRLDYKKGIKKEEQLRYTDVHVLEAFRSRPHP